MPCNQDWSRLDGMVNIEQPMWALHCGAHCRPLSEIEKAAIDKSSSFGLVWDARTSRHPGNHNIVGVKCEPLKNENHLPLGLHYSVTHDSRLGKYGRPRISFCKNLVVTTWSSDITIRSGNFWLSSILSESQAQSLIVSPWQLISLAYETVFRWNGERTEEFFWTRPGWIAGVVGKLHSVGFRGPSCVESACGFGKRNSA